MSCGMAHWPSVVLMLLSTQYFVLQRRNPGTSVIHPHRHFSGSHLGKSVQITILHDATQVSYAGISQNTKYAWFLDGEGFFLARLT